MVEALTQRVVLFIPQFVIGLVIFAAFWFSSFLLQRIIIAVGERRELDRDVMSLLGQTTQAITLVVGAITALGTMGVNVTALVAGLGLTGFALGFALRDVLSNFLAGLLILIYRPFRRNDRISVATFEGIVTQIDLRYTTLQADKDRILIPNSTLFQAPVRVWGNKE